MSSIWAMSLDLVLGVDLVLGCSFGWGFTLGP